MLSEFGSLGHHYPALPLLLHQPKEVKMIGTKLTQMRMRLKYSMFPLRSFKEYVKSVKGVSGQHV